VESIEVITAIHHPVRRRIVDHLVLHEVDQVTAVARALGLQVGSASHHIRVLERAGVAERVEDPNGDRRTSWWRLRRTSFSWSAADFTDRPADALLARESEGANVTAQLSRLRAWRARASDDGEWTQAAFSMDHLGWATAEELAELADALQQTVSRWRRGIDRSDEQERRPVFVFAHGFPTEP
jgi:DNA-binding transcriptional ArsR family regulator